MLGFQRLAGAILWSVLIFVRWCHGQFIVSPAQWWLDTVVSTAEESTKTAVREVFAVSTRIINGIATWLVALFLDRDFYSKTRRGEERRRTRAWQAFWAHNSKVGTLNAVIEQEGFIPTSPSTPNKKPVQKDVGGRKLSLRRSGSELFNRPAGFAVAERAERKGLGESVRLSMEISIETVFTAFRSTVSRLLMLQYGEQQHPHRVLSSQHSSTSRSHFMSRSDSNSSNGGAGPMYDEVTLTSKRHHARSTAPLSSRRRSRSFGGWEELSVWTASDAILHCGYPLEEHIVTTADGYVLTMQRLPRKESRDVVFFQHGVLDTSLGWVANGPQGSQAFAAFDRGADVWLGNSRANPPRAHTDPRLSGGAYWCFSINELGMEDVAAMIHRIHTVKCVELNDLTLTTHGHSESESPWQHEEDKAVRERLHRPSPGVSTKYYHHQRSGSDSALASMHRISVAIENAFGDNDGQVNDGSNRILQTMPEPKEKMFGAGGSPKKGDRVIDKEKLLRQRSLGSFSFPLGPFNDKNQAAQQSCQPLQSSECKLDAEISDVTPLPLDSVLLPNYERAVAGDSEGLMPDRASVGGREQAEMTAGIPESSMGRYNLRAVGHSLGGASLLIYAVMCQKMGKPHHISRLVLLTPAGFHRQYPALAGPFLYLLPLVMKLLRTLRPGVGTPAYIPSSLLRYITFKLTVDLQHIPALNELTRAGLRLLFNGDASEWDRALQMPHYAVASMPAISLHTGAHLIQLMNSKRFELFDYGSADANRLHYGTDRPPDVAAQYHLLAGLPVDLVAGRADGVIARDDVASHYEAMKAAGMEVTYKEFDVGHLDVTFAVKDEVQHYVISRLRLGSRAAFS